MGRPSGVAGQSQPGLLGPDGLRLLVIASSEVSPKIKDWQLALLCCITSGTAQQGTLNADNKIRTAYPEWESLMRIRFSQKHANEYRTMYNAKNPSNPI